MMIPRRTSGGWARGGGAVETGPIDFVDSRVASSRPVSVASAAARGGGWCGEGRGVLDIIIVIVMTLALPVPFTHRRRPAAPCRETDDSAPVRQK